MALLCCRSDRYQTARARDGLEDAINHVQSKAAEK